LTAKFTLKNIGRSVAGHVYIRTKALAVGLVDPFDIPLNEQKALCNGPNAYVRDKPNIDTRYTIFPKDSQVEFDMTGFGTKQIKEMVLDLTLKNGKPVVPLLVGCVDYDYPSASVPHQTGFIYEVYGKNPVHGIQTSMTFRVDQLEFRPYTFGGKYAY
jgi:hypothetical protein